MPNSTPSLLFSYSHSVAAALFKSGSSGTMSQTQQAMALLIDVFHQYSGKEGNPLSLSKGELKDLLKNEFGDLLGKANDQAAMDRVFNALDADKDNSVDFNEYINLVCCLTMMCNDFFIQNK
ncbi:hypothetical protein GJAV_G00102900 [Gymnothorax javanicus]|nr:hypothetical protein GJAV_G00102900 [Gymnothorax javanicus]